jgi:hypothetical protein
MTGKTDLEIIKAHQKHWAEKQKWPFHPKKDNYTLSLRDNLYLPLSKKSQEEFGKGDGSETDGNPAKMQALHSSSALLVNVFEYLKQNKRYKDIAQALEINNSGIKNIIFERKFPVLDRPANLDLCIEYEDGHIVGVESKFTEPYSQKNGFKDSYFEAANEKIWKDLNELRETAERINNESSLKEFKYLDAAQLIKHTIGLKKEINDKNKFQLIYLYYSVKNGVESNNHEIEIKKFEKIIKKDNINFKALNWDKVIGNLDKLLAKNNDDEEFIKYIKTRYIIP